MKIRIGSRRSDLAIWQAKFVAERFTRLGHEVSLHLFTSEGDRVLDTPLPLMGGRGVFTKTLDDALLKGEIDFAVHSLKDIPTELPNNICIAAVMERDAYEDVLVSRRKDITSKLKNTRAVIATSSNRRKAQWVRKYPNHEIVDIRGNINTRLKKTLEGTLDGAIFAKAGLIRLGLEDKISDQLDWMVPAPAQGVIAVSSTKSNRTFIDIVRKINHAATELCTQTERSFLHTLNGGCSAPIGAIAKIENNKIHFEGIALNNNGSEELNVKMKKDLSEGADIGVLAAKQIIEKGADKLVDQAKDKK